MQENKMSGSCLQQTCEEVDGGWICEWCVPESVTASVFLTRTLRALQKDVLRACTSSAWFQGRLNSRWCFQKRVWNPPLDPVARRNPLHPAARGIIAMRSRNPPEVGHSGQCLLSFCRADCAALSSLAVYLVNINVYTSEQEQHCGLNSDLLKFIVSKLEKFWTSWHLFQCLCLGDAFWVCYLPLTQKFWCNTWGETAQLNEAEKSHLVPELSFKFLRCVGNIVESDCS